ncbi:MAG: metal-dependent hydrolase [Planctomycetes bacterium]|nr:metal-dependent hydrolase [Planctomycetota bacterium]
MPTELTWLGHATWSIRTGYHTILVDPFLDDSPTAPVKSADVSPDYILVSHGHFDHMADAVKIAERTGATVISNYEICEWFGKQGVRNTHPQNTGGGFRHPFGRLKLTIAHHSSTLPDGTPAGNPSGFLLTLDDGKIYLACDTALFYDMKLIGGAGIDLAILPIGDNFTMGPDDAVAATKLIEPRKVAPTHYNTWPVIAQDAQAWAARIRAETKAEPIVVEPGGKFQL